jgi:type I restriction-modification system DNA methylase subunit
MPLFQKSVINKYYNELSIEELQKSFLDYQSIFNNPVKQQNILNAKEEQYQEGFLRELFVKILGYTLYPDGNHNLITEQKNETNSKKADGAILNGLNVIAVIELKSTKTIDLASIESQAFSYKNNQQECKYVITSNFKKLRFYIDNAVEFLEFDLFNLNFEDFKLLWVCLSSNYLLRNIPAQIKEASNHQEEKITKYLYADYAKFRNELFNDICEKNKDHDKLFLFKKTQKLLDRFLFLFFAEDRGLVAPNWTRKILQDWTDLKDKYDNYIPLYTRFRKNFDYLNTGYYGKDGEIFAYNGGLFAPDEVLNNLLINDDLLYKGALKISNYDFDSEVDVNILGHIFEHSLNEIDEIQASLEEVKVEKVTKRKKDGVFYTPKYITKYIVENTIGTLCKNEKDKLQILEEDFEFIDVKAKGKEKSKRESLNKKIGDYRKWLLELKIVDPACGSGAFLNQALEFLIAEHSKLDELRSKLLGGSIVLSDVETSILENNLYGVDINEEAVEIAKLSLWLRTARKGRKLNSLNNNLKCGNSLIDSTEVAGDKAFNWKEEFEDVFDKGGFDVVIGNPPYVNANDLKKYSTVDEYKFLKKEYETAKGTVDLYIYFFEKGLKIINQNGLLSFITPNRFLSASYGKALREFIINDFKIESIIDYSDKNVFPDASTYPVITTLKFKEVENYEIITGKFDDISKQLKTINFSSSKLKILEDYILGFLLNDKLKITEKVIEQSESLENAGKINATSTAKEADDYSILINEEKGYKLINTGTIDPYCTKWGIDFLTDKGQKILFPYLPKNSNLISNNRNNLYNSPKIIISKIGLRCEAFYDENGEYASINTNCIHSFNSDFLPEYILCWINSKLYNYLFECLFDGLRMSGGYLLYSAPNLKNTNIKVISLDKQKEFIFKYDLMKNNLERIEKLSSNYLNLLSSKFFHIELNKRIREWHNLSPKDFFKELEKQKVKLSLSEQSEWLQYFEEQKSIALAIKVKIEQTEKEIDQMVYKLYELTEEEIKIVDGA